MSPGQAEVDASPDLDHVGAGKAVKGEQVALVELDKGRILVREQIARPAGPEHLHHRFKQVGCAGGGGAHQWPAQLDPADGVAAPAGAGKGGILFE